MYHFWALLRFGWSPNSHDFTPSGGPPPTLDKWIRIQVFKVRIRIGEKKQIRPDPGHWIQQQQNNYMLVGFITFHLEHKGNMGNIGNTGTNTV